MIVKLKQHYYQIPEQVRQFLLRGLIIFIVWKVAYIFFLLPGRMLDGPLTEVTGYLTAQALSLFTEASSFVADNKSFIYIDGDKAVHIADSCNGLILFIIHLGFIIAFPSTLKRKLLFGIGGVLTIFALNIIRCAVLAVISREYLTIVDHHFVFNLIIYALIFLIWQINSRALADEKA